MTFEIFNGGEFIRREEMSAQSITIGKGAAAMLRIDHAGLADLHAVLNVGPDGAVRFHNVVGDNSTTVNGVPVSNGPVANGDTLGFGPVRVVFRLVDGADAEETVRLDPASAAYAAAVSAPPAPAPAPKAAAPKVEVAKVEAPKAVRAPAAAPVAAPAESAADDDDGPVEDVMSFVLRTSASDATSDRARGKLLEVAQVFGEAVVDLQHFDRAGRVTLGSNVVRIFSGGAQKEGQANFFVAADMLPQQNFPLFEPAGNGWVCNALETWTGFVEIGEERRTFEQLLAEGLAQRAGSVVRVAINDETRLVVDLGTTAFAAQLVFPKKKIVTAPFSGTDWQLIVILALTGLLGIGGGIGLYVSMLNYKPDDSANKVDDHLVEMLLEKKEEEQPKDEKKPDKNPDAGEGAKAKKEEGKVGKKDAKMDRAKGEKVQMQKQQLDKQVAENAGLLGALRNDSALDGMLGNTGMNADMMSGIGGLIGAKGTQMGSGGLGARGSGLGGGGTADGLGGMGTKGRGSGSSGYGSGGGDFGAKGEGGIGAVGGDPIILGALDKSLIDAVIKRNMAQIRYCYQRELTKNPTLGGKITVKFTIAKDGTVSSASTKSSTMGNEAVETCINTRFMKFQFPEPKGGGVVIVSYPFIFSPG
jgi:hypothetical protein